MDKPFQPGDKAIYKKPGFTDVPVTIVGAMSDGRYAVESAPGNLWCAPVHDLMPPASAPERVVRWVNLYRDGYTGICHDIDCSEGHSGAIARTRVILTPGQYDTEDTPSEYERGRNDGIDAAIKALLPLCTDHTNRSYDAALMDAESAMRALKRGNGHA